MLRKKMYGESEHFRITNHSLSQNIAIKTAHAYSGMDKHVSGME